MASAASSRQSTASCAADSSRGCCCQYKLLSISAAAAWPCTKQTNGSYVVVGRGKFSLAAAYVKQGQLQCKCTTCSCTAIVRQSRIKFGSLHAAPAPSRVVTVALAHWRPCNALPGSNPGSTNSLSPRRVKIEHWASCQCKKLNAQANSCDRYLHRSLATHASSSQPLCRHARLTADLCQVIQEINR